MVFKPNKLYQMKTATSKCFGCILQGLSDDISGIQGAIIHRAGNCSRLTQCACADGEKWVKITEEQAMEVLLGG